MSGKSIALDLDGTLAKPLDNPSIYKIGDPYPQAAAFTQILKGRFHIIIHTARLNNSSPRQIQIMLRIIKSWLYKHGFAYDRIWTGTGKPTAFAYIDNNAIVCRPEEEGFSYTNILEQLKEELKK